MNQRDRNDLINMLIEWIEEDRTSKSTNRANPDAFFYNDTDEVNLTALSLALQIERPDLDEEDADQLAYDAAAELGF